MAGGDDGQRFDVPVYEMFWDCEYCGADKLLGKTHRHCPQCGAAQDPSSRYFPPEEEKVAVQDHVYFGADWKCASCDTPNSNASAFCGNCGTPKDGAKKVGLAHEKEAPPAPPPAPEEPKKSGGGGGRGMLIFGCLGAVVLGFVVLCGLATFWNRTDAATVTSHTWSRSVQIQEYKSVSETDWCDEMPSGAEDVRTTQKQRDTKKVPDGEDCETKNVDNGDGTFRQEEECTTRYREEPIMDDWCSYTVAKWADLREATADGDGLSPVWPQTQLKTCSSPRLGCQREGTRSESYTLKLKGSDGDALSCTLSESAWRNARDGQQIEVSINMLTGAASCD